MLRLSPSISQPMVQLQLVVTCATLDLSTTKTTKTKDLRSQTTNKMVPIAQPPKDVLARWEESGQLQTKSWVARIHESVLSFPSIWDFSTMQLSKLDPYCKTSHDGEAYLELSGFTAILRRFVPEPAWAGLDATAPVLWQIFTYVGGYPFLTPGPKSETRDRLSRTEFICAVSFLHPDFSDRLFNSDNDERTRARTNADQRRLIFQALASPQPRRR